MIFLFCFTSYLYSSSLKTLRWPFLWPSEIQLSSKKISTVRKPLCVIFLCQWEDCSSQKCSMAKDQSNICSSLGFPKEQIEDTLSRISADLSLAVRCAHWVAPFEVGLNDLTCICLEKEINFEQGEREKERQKDVLVSLPSVGAGKEKRGRERRVNSPRGIPLGH